MPIVLNIPSDILQNKHFYNKFMPSYFIFWNFRFWNLINVYSWQAIISRNRQSKKTEITLDNIQNKSKYNQKWDVSYRTKCLGIHGIRVYHLQLRFWLFIHNVLHLIYIFCSSRYSIICPILTLNINDLNTFVDLAIDHTGKMWSCSVLITVL